MVPTVGKRDHEAAQLEHPFMRNPKSKRNCFPQPSSSPALSLCRSTHSRPTLRTVRRQRRPRRRRPLTPMFRRKLASPPRQARLTRPARSLTKNPPLTSPSIFTPATGNPVCPCLSEATVAADVGPAWSAAASVVRCGGRSPSRPECTVSTNGEMILCT